MKKLICLMIALLMVLAMAGCANEQAASNEEVNGTIVPEENVTPAEKVSADLLK